MEDTLREERRYSYIGTAESLNPCSNGRYSQSSDVKLPELDA